MRTSASMRTIVLSQLCFAVCVLTSSPASAVNCKSDASLQKVAKRLSEKPDHVPSGGQLIRMARRADFDGAPIFAKIGSVDEQSEFDAWHARIARKSDGPLRCGDVSRAGVRALVVAGVAGTISLSRSGLVYASVVKGFTAPFLVARLADGEQKVIELVSKGGELAPAPLPSTTQIVQLIATGPRGPRPVAERWLSDDVAQTQSLPIAASPRLWIKGLRQVAKVRSLRDNKLLSTEADAHAKKMCASDRIGHTLERGSDPRIRLKRRGLMARHVGEALARAQTINDAMLSLQQSPSHKLTLVDKRYTDVGIGQAADPSGKQCLVVLLAAWPRAAPK